MAAEFEDAAAALIHSVACGDIEAVRLALGEGASPDAVDQHGRTLLAISCQSGQIEVARALLDCGASVNLGNGNGTTPLMYAKTYAFKSGDVSLLALLISNGADVNAQDNRGLTALDYTIEHAKLVSQFLCAHGAMPDRSGFAQDLPSVLLDGLR